MTTEYESFDLVFQGFLLHPGRVASPIRNISAVLVALVLASSAAGCSQTAEEQAQPEIPIGTTAAPLVDGSTAVALDAAYLTGVLDQLGAVRAQVRRDTVDRRDFGDLTQRRLRAIYTGEALNGQMSIWSDTALVGDPDIKANAGAAKYTITQIVEATNECVWLEALVDENDNVNTPFAPQRFAYVLVRADHDLTLNPTPWMWKQATAPGLLTKERACG